MTQCRQYYIEGEVHIYKATPGNSKRWVAHRNWGQTTRQADLTASGDGEGKP
jgi:hypothetical protein